MDNETNTVSNAYRHQPVIAASYNERYNEIVISSNTYQELPVFPSCPIWLAIQSRSYPYALEEAELLQLGFRAHSIQLLKSQCPSWPMNRP